MCLHSQVYSESESGDSGEGEAGSEGGGGVLGGGGNNLNSVACGATSVLVSSSIRGALDVGTSGLGAGDLGGGGEAVGALSGSKLDNGRGVGLLAGDGGSAFILELLLISNDGASEPVSLRSLKVGSGLSGESRHWLEVNGVKSASGVFADDVAGVLDRDESENRDYVSGGGGIELDVL